MWVSQSGLTYRSQVFLSADGGIGVWSEGDPARCPAPFSLGLQDKTLIFLYGHRHKIQLN